MLNEKKLKAKVTVLGLAFVLLTNFAFICTVNAADDAWNEFGIWYERYPDTWRELQYSDDDADAFADVLTADVWTKSYDKDSDYSLDSHWITSTDNSYVDNCDFVYFVGHGGEFDVQDPYSRFYMNYSRAIGDDEVVDADECNWGDNDLEWVFLYACQTLNEDEVDDWDDAFDGLHGMCGFDTTTWQNNSAWLGEEFAENLVDEECIGSAWQSATEWKFPSSRVAACYRAVINRPGTSDFDYWYESLDNFVDDYGTNGYTLDNIDYTDWTC